MKHLVLLNLNSYEDSMEPVPAPAALQDTNDVIMMITDVFHGEHLGDCVAARVLRGFINMNALKPMVFLPSKLPVQVKSKCLLWDCE